MNNPKQSQYSTKTRCWASCKHWPRKGQTEIVLIYLSAVSHKCVFPNLNSVITPPGECWDFLHTRRVRVWGWDWFSALGLHPVELKWPESHLLNVTSRDLSDIYSETKIQTHSDQLCWNFQSSAVGLWNEVIFIYQLSLPWERPVITPQQQHCW